MKKYFLIAVMAIACVAFVNAQPRAIGLRLGGFNGVSYQHSLGESNMLEVEAGFSMLGRSDFWVNGAHDNLWGHSVQAAVTYDWIDPFGATFPTMPKGEWHWYMGVGGAGGYGWSAWVWAQGWGSASGNINWGFAAAAGRVGVEYDFWFPLQLSVDWRPTLGAGLFENGNGGVQAGLYWEVASISLSARYKF